MKKVLFSFFLFLFCLFSAYAENHGHIAEYGHLKLVGNQLSSQDGNAVQLKGFNTGVITADNQQGLSKEAFQAMKDLGCESVRLNYSPSTHSKEMVELMKSYIDLCAEVGIYAIVDWHLLEGGTTQTGNPTDYVEEASDFFKAISAYAKEKGYFHLIYEICNEPSQVVWKTIKEYAATILPIIEGNDPGAIVIVGTCDWCQKINAPASDPIKAEDYNLGILYAFHYSACTHFGELANLNAEIEAIPLFISEWSSSDYTYASGKFCDKESQDLLTFVNKRGVKISWNYWSWSGENGLWKNSESGFGKENLTEAGSFILGHGHFIAKSEWEANFKEYGRLKVVGNQLRSQNGTAIQLKGFSTGVIIANDEKCLSKEDFQAMKDWGCTLVRLNYSPSTHSEAMVEQLKKYIDICAEIGLYAIVDWHLFEGNTTQTGNPNDYIQEASNFFSSISEYAKEKGYFHLIYEICNEPSHVSWENIKGYASTILPIIEDNNPGSIVIVGTPDWCQEIEEARYEPIKKIDYDLGIMYAFHYYACNHNHLLSHLSQAISDIPVFVSEWSSSDIEYTPNNSCVQPSIDLLNLVNGNKQKISWSYWAWREDTGIWKECGAGFNRNNLTQTGVFIAEIGGFKFPSEWEKNFSEYGKLKLVGNQLSSQNGDAIQLKGFNTGILSAENDKCLSKEDFQTMKDWGYTSVRLNYSPSTHSEEMVELMKKYIDICAEVGLYAIVDWHLFEGHTTQTGNPKDYAKDASDFFSTISEYAKEKGYFHLIYEICSEPSQVEWDDVKDYAASILPIIEGNNPGAIVIVGTCDWSQNIDKASQDPIKAENYYLGIMYAFHYYACNHQNLLPRLSMATYSIPVFVSEWSTSDSHVTPDKICFEPSIKLFNELNNEKQKISWNYWAWGGESGIWKECGAGFTRSNLTQAGSIIAEIENFPIKSEWNANFSEYGKLKLVGNQLRSQKGDAVQLKGFNTGMITAESDQCLSKEDFQTMKDWGCKSVRLNYSPSTHSEAMVELLENYIDICAEVGLYAIVDWHLLEGATTQTGNPMDYVNEASDFFNTISAYAKEKGYFHLIYDICNEPSNVNWSVIKEYAYDILPIIEGNNPGANVIVGTPNWSLNLSYGAADPIKAENYCLGILYAFHYAACSHVNQLTEVVKARDIIPVFISEWSSSDITYDPEIICVENSEKLLELTDMEENKISWNYWAWTGETGIWKDCEAGFKSENMTKAASYILTETKELEFTERIRTSIQEIEDDNLVSVSPNPTNKAFSITFKERATVCIYNATGQKVFEKEGSNLLHINENFATGIYNITVKGNDYVKNVKLIIR